MTRHTILTASPAPEYRDDVLLRVWARFGTPVLRAMRTGLFNGTSANENASIGLSNFFGLDASDHCFDAAPLRWLNMREPQVTAGIAHFLTRGDFSVARQRRRAFLEAAFAASGRLDLAELLAGCVIVASKAAAEEARVDLLVEGDLTSGSRIGAVVEAKFGHHLTRGQLPKARRHAASKGLDPSCAAFLVVLPRLEDIGTRVFPRSANRDWVGVSWFDLLLRLERLLPPEADDHAFRTFRRTIWWMSYG